MTLPDLTIYPLRRREVTTLEMLASGYAIDEIAVALNTKIAHVLRNVVSARHALGCENDFQAFITAYRDGLIHPELPDRKEVPPPKPPRKLTQAERNRQTAKWRKTWTASRSTHKPPVHKNGMSPEGRERQRAAAKAYAAAHKEENAERQRQFWANMTDEEKKEFKAKQSAGNKRAWANFTPEEQARFKANLAPPFTKKQQQNEATSDRMVALHQKRFAQKQGLRVEEKKP